MLVVVVDGPLHGPLHGKMSRPYQLYPQD